MRNKYYFLDADDEYCYSYESLKQIYSKDSVEVYEAIPIKIDDFFYCKFHKEIGSRYDIWDRCGKVCNGYNPRNGKSGCCKYYSNKLFEHGNKITINLQ